MILAYEQDGWRFTWNCEVGYTVKIGPESGSHPNGVAVNWSHQMDPPTLEDEDGNPFTFRTILRDFETDCKSWLLDYEADR